MKNIKSNKKPLQIVIFGATGDLYKNKLAIALFNLFKNNFLPKDFTIIGFGRRPLGESGFRIVTEEALLKKNKKSKELNEFLTHIKYVEGNLESLEDFKKLKTTLGIMSNNMFYLAISPSLYKVVLVNIYKSKISTIKQTGNGGGFWNRILIEKPFGRNLKEAQSLGKFVTTKFSKMQVFLVDHYLAKQGLQEMINFKLKNKLFNQSLNSTNINKVRIVFHEESVVGTRGGFYDNVGALCDVGQNHMLVMFSSFAMKFISSISTTLAHNRLAVLDKTEVISKKDNKIIRGQYEGYLNEINVKPNSKTETFFRVYLGINNPEWKDVVFEFEGGKALDTTAMFVEIIYKNNKKVKFDISPDKKNYKDAYEKVFEEALLNKTENFLSLKEIFKEWGIIHKIIKSWHRIPLSIYEKGIDAKNIY
jgi:glucose-6-phosphate 1-dehydrogenase